MRAACTPALLASGAFGYGGSVVVQNAGITRTSVTHAALLIGAVPVMVAVVAALWRRTVARPVAWTGFALSLAGVGLITGGRGGGATAVGDGLVLASLMLSAVFTVAQEGLLRGRDPIAVTAVQFLGAALAALPFAAVTEGVPATPHNPGAVLAAAALAVGGTVLPFTLFAYGQSRISAEVAGAFYNIEPLVGAAAGIVLFGDPAGPVQAVGGAAIIAGIALSSLPLLGARRSAAAGGSAGPDAGAAQAAGTAIQARMQPKPALPGSCPPGYSCPSAAGTRARSQPAWARGTRVSRPRDARRAAADARAAAGPLVDDVIWRHAFLARLAGLGFPAPRPLPCFGGKSWTAGRDALGARLLPARPRRGLGRASLSRSAQPGRWRHSLARSPYTTSSRRPSGKASPCRSSPSSTKPSRRARARLRLFAGSVCNETRSMPSAPKA